MKGKDEGEVRAKFVFGEAPGRYPVGLKVIEQYDHSRTFPSRAETLRNQGSSPLSRALQTLIWYPAVSAVGKAMTLSSYGELWATETTFGRPHKSWRIREFLSGLSSGIEARLQVSRDAEAAPGLYPLIVYAPSFSALSWENLDLCEYLASFGYVVMASPSMGQTTRAMTSDVAGIEAQARDISFLIGQSLSLPGADVSSVGVIGFSWGGLSNVLAAARDRRIRALVALDGSLRTHGSLLSELPDVRLEHMRLPLLSIAQGQFTQEERDCPSISEARDANLLNAWSHADLFALYFFSLAHGEFASLYQRSEDLWEDHFKAWHGSKAGCQRRDAIEAYGWLARYTRAFLDGYLKEDEDARRYLTRAPTENGVPPHLMSLHFHAGSGEPASLEGFQARLERQGFAHAARIYGDLQRQDPTFRLTDESIVAWAQDLILDQQVAKATALLEFATHLYPRSCDSWVSLGDAHAEAGERHKAGKAYRAALELDAAHIDAIRKLRKLTELS